MTRQSQLWRDPAQVLAQSSMVTRVSPGLLKYRTSDDFFELLGNLGITLFVSREYEHLVMALNASSSGRPRISYLSLPHPSGIVVDRKRKRLHIASTRNPNQVFTCAPSGEPLKRTDRKFHGKESNIMVPVCSTTYPGAMYIHDLALIGGELYANASGMNAVAKLEGNGSFKLKWWPRCIETAKGPVFEKNHIQLNSIAPGNSLKDSQFSASSTTISSRRPGHRNYPVDKRGVIIDGKTREPTVRGLTRPHSARKYRNALWVDNSGYGEFGKIEKGKFLPVTKLPGWTRGLCFSNGVAFVGVSRVLARFTQYAPGLDVRKSRCGIYAVDISSGKLLGSITWPEGNQIFAVDWIKEADSSGMPFTAGRRRTVEKDSLFFYSFTIGGSKYA